MRTFTKILTLSALLLALCQAAIPGMISLSDNKKCNALGIGKTSGIPECKVHAIEGKCSKGFHKDDKHCLPNTKKCAKDKYDKTTFNCKTCKWYAFHVQNDAESAGTKNGDYCETRWWWVSLWIILSVIGVMVILAIIKFVCCKSKSPKEGKRLLDTSKARGSSGHDSRVHRSNEMVDVQRSRPVHYETREVHRESSPVHHQSREVYRESSPVHHQTREVYRESSPRGHTQARTAYTPYGNAQNLASHAY
jgi:hypothetical protein